jgi:hypothetical protein
VLQHVLLLRRSNFWGEWKISPHQVIEQQPNHVGCQLFNPDLCRGAEKGKQRYLVYGKRGWIGGEHQLKYQKTDPFASHCLFSFPIQGMMISLLKKSGKEFFLADARCENRESVKSELLKYKPTHVLNAAGVTGSPNVDWCEFNQEATLRSNVLGSMTVSCLELQTLH